jgi:predicted RNase H-like nuclease (RuvC/YqgF family)
VDWLSEIIKIIIVSSFVGGGLWKGLEAIAEALSKRAAAVNLAERLDFDQMQANYTNAMDLIDKQAKRIDVLTEKVEKYEARIYHLNDKINRQEREQGDKELAYAQEIKALKCELETVRQEYKTLQVKYNKLHTEHMAALERIEALEKGDTGPLKEP